MKKSYFKYLIIASAIFYGVMNPLALKAEEKVCTVLLMKALNESEEGKKSKALIEADLTAKKKQLDSLKTDLKTKRDEIEKQKMVLSKEALEIKSNEIQTKFLELQQKAMQYEQELKQKENESVQKIVTAQRGIVVELAKQKGCTLLYENSADVLLYTKNAEDLTTAVIQAYNTQKK